MNANELADLIGLCGDGGYNQDAANMLRQQQEQIDKLASVVALREKLIVELNGRIERMIEKQSHYEAMEHAAGFEAGRQLGMKQEKALWELAASTQEIEK
jgi:hypothetical protein